MKTFLCYEGVDVLRSIDRRKKDLMGRDDVCYVGSICECMYVCTYAGRQYSTDRQTEMCGALRVEDWG